ncbi:THOC1 [Mytilus coruscus]|uniref:THOC1 n=1 Tax=Mytilus coruscus TaxID=42192 RepID=A0A6J7ZVU2_MYTCO|nr:THOC1 [Mytilus coruscus]
MAASIGFNFLGSVEKFTNALRESLSQKSNEECITVYKSYNGSESEKKSAMDQALRDIVRDLVMCDSGCDIYKIILEHSIDLAKQDACSHNTPLVILSDIFDVITIEQCQEVFNLVEQKLSVWKSKLFYDTGKNYLLRMCNDILRRLSKSQNTVFCGRIQLFLSRLFPLSEKSALNLMSNFNLENVTTFMANDGGKLKKENGEDKMEVEDGEMDDGCSPVDYNLYRRFWSLQDIFRKPNQCYEKLPWKQFVANSEAVLKAFASAKLDDNKSSRRKLDKRRQTETKSFFAKYLTSEKLLDLQLNDSNFRRYVLVQMLILFQYLTAQVRFKSSSQVLSEDNLTWTKTTQDKVYQLIRETPPDGDSFAKTVEHTLTREEFWNKWKNDSCPSFEKEPMSENPKHKTKAKRRWVGDDLQASGGKFVKMGSAELTRLWNLSPDNMDACKDEKRVFLPSLEDYFSDAIDQNDPEAMIEDQYKLINDQIFQWKSLRLLARRSPHFFTHTNTPAVPQPQYLEMMLNRLAKEIHPNTGPQSMQENQVEVKTDIGDEEEAIKESQEDNDLRQSGDQGKEDENNEDALTPQLMEELSKQVGSMWKRLGLELNFPEDDISYFEKENESNQERALKMLTVWQETDPDRATISTVKMAMKEVGMTEAMEAVFGVS